MTCRSAEWPISRPANIKEPPTADGLACVPAYASSRSLFFYPCSCLFSTQYITRQRRLEGGKSTRPIVPRGRPISHSPVFPILPGPITSIIERCRRLDELMRPHWETSPAVEISPLPRSASAARRDSLERSESRSCGISSAYISLGLPGRGPQHPVYSISPSVIVHSPRVLLSPWPSHLFTISNNS